MSAGAPPPYPGMSSAARTAGAPPSYPGLGAPSQLQAAGVGSAGPPRAYPGNGGPSSSHPPRQAIAGATAAQLSSPPALGKQQKQQQQPTQKKAEEPPPPAYTATAAYPGYGTEPGLSSSSSSSPASAAAVSPAAARQPPPQPDDKRQREGSQADSAALQPPAQKRKLSAFEQAMAMAGALTGTAPAVEEEAVEEATDAQESQGEGGGKGGEVLDGWTGGADASVTAQPISIEELGALNPRLRVEFASQAPHAVAAQLEDEEAEREEKGEEDEDELVTSVLKVPGRTIGLVLGQGGETLRQMQIQSEADIQVSKGDEHAEKRLVVVIGSQREVALGEVLVMKVATGVSIELKTPVAPSDAGKGVFVDPDLKSEAVFFPAAHIGFVIGRGGETIKRLQDSSGASIQIAKVPTGKEPPGTKQVDLSGTPQQLEHVKKLLDELRTKSQTMPVRGHSAGQLYSDGGRQRGRVGPGQEQEILMVKQSVIGGIIGKGGSTIRQMQEQSGAHIQLQKDHEVALGNPHRAVTIIGKKYEIDAAKELILNMSAQEDARHAAEWQVKQSTFHHQQQQPQHMYAPQTMPAAAAGGNPMYAQQMQYFQYYGGYYDAQQQWMQGAPQP